MEMNPFSIHEPWIKIAKNELIFEKYRMDLNQDKYDIEVQKDDDAINCNQILFDLMPWTFNLLDGFYLRERYILMDVIMEDQMRKRIAAENWKAEQRNKD